MKTFNVFKHPVFGYEAVKIGFSWPGLLFTPIWAFVKKLWLHATAAASVILALTFIQAAFDKHDVAIGSFLAALLQLCVSIFVGVKGNEWREENLRSRGYESISTVQAPTPDAAVALTVK